MRKIDVYLQNIADRVGEPVGLFVFQAESGIGNAVRVTDPNGHLNIYDHSGALHTSSYIIRTLKDPKKNITCFRLVLFPGCCALCISTGVTVWDPFKRLGINTIGNKIRQEIAKIAGFTGIVCTDIEANTGERKTLINNKWTDAFKIKNRRTRNHVILSVKELDHSA